jgi:hypothetical protein
MNENENNFESLRRALALKRHEIPPPGYFHNFSGKVLARIRAGETQESSVAWFSKLIEAFKFKPAFAGAFASALCLLLVFGIVYAERPDVMPQTQTFLQPMSQPDGAATQLAAASPMSLPQTSEPTGIIASTNPVLSLQPVASLFGEQNQFAQQVNFTVPGN